MSRSKASNSFPPDSQSKLGPDAERQIRTFVDDLLDNRGLRRLFLEGLNNPSILGELAKRTGVQIPRDASLILRFKRALQKKDRVTLLSIVRQDFAQHPVPQGKEIILTDVKDRVLTATVARKALISIADTLKRDSAGRPALIAPDEYSELADRADLLEPVILKLLENPPNETGRTLEEHLAFMKGKHDVACTFLERYIPQLKHLLSSKNLPKAAKKSETKARVIADALAGRDRGLSFKTSIERVRQGRRERDRLSDSKSAN